MIPKNPADLRLLDGGLATELENRGCDLQGDLWSARILFEYPEAIVDVHRAYLDAGADVLITASYQATSEGLIRRGFSRAASERLLRRSVDLAARARAEFWRRNHLSGRLFPWIAASVGPYGAALADGSEYSGDYDLDENGLRAFHAPRFEILDGAGADLLAIETIPSAPEARVLAQAAARARTPAWMSFSCDQGRLHDGTPLPDVVDEVLHLAGDRLVGVGINCLPPEQAEKHLLLLRERTELPLVVYPNSGEIWDGEKKVWRPGRVVQDDDAFAALARRWYDAGARWIGGCCRTRPETIAAVRRGLVKFPSANLENRRVERN